MSTITVDLDLKRYGRLLARTVPQVIKTEEENERLLMQKGEENLTPEDDALIERARPVIAGLLLAAEVVMRQEALIVLFPRSWRRVAVTSLAAGLPLVAFGGLPPRRFRSASRDSLRPF